MLIIEQLVPSSSSKVFLSTLALFSADVGSFRILRVRRNKKVAEKS